MRFHNKGYCSGLCLYGKYFARNDDAIYIIYIGDLYKYVNISIQRENASETLVFVKDIPMFKSFTIGDVQFYFGLMFKDLNFQGILHSFGLLINDPRAGNML